MESNTENNIFLIKRKLASLERKRGLSHYEYCVGRFIVKIFTHKMQDIPYDEFDSILQHSEVDVLLYEIPKQFFDGKPPLVSVSISLEKDSRFANYNPIKYKTYNGQSNGDDMPILHLCELINYLYKLEKLSAFL